MKIEIQMIFYYIFWITSFLSAGLFIHHYRSFIGVYFALMAWSFALDFGIRERPQLIPKYKTLDGFSGVPFFLQVVAHIYLAVLIVYKLMTTSYT